MVIIYLLILAANAESLGAIVLPANSIDDFKQALVEAKKMIKQQLSTSKQTASREWVDMHGGKYL